MMRLFALFALLSSVSGFLHLGSTRICKSRKCSLNMLDIDKSESLVYDTKTNRLYEANLDKEDEFTLFDETSGDKIYLTREEKERIFLDSLQSYYFSGKNNLPDDQFDKLKEELTWEGSTLTTLNRNETLFLNAITSYNKGTPILKDAEFDDLKRSLAESGSKIAVVMQPQCYVESGICKVTWQPDSVRTGSLYVPAQLFLSFIYIGLVYEIPFLDINPVIALLIGSVPISIVAKQITENLIFKNPSVAVGPCPTCGSENRIFFGDVLGVKGDDEQAAIKCTNCKTEMTIKRSTLRVSTLISKRPGAPAAAAAAADE